jgi:hypothetical protein
MEFPYSLKERFSPGIYGHTYILGYGSCRA